MIARISVALIIFIVVSVMLLCGYGWALLVSVVWDIGRIKEYYEDTGFWKQYKPVWTCLHRGIEFV